MELPYIDPMLGIAIIAWSLFSGITAIFFAWRAAHLSKCLRDMNIQSDEMRDSLAKERSRSAFLALKVVEKQETSRPGSNWVSQREWACAVLDLDSEILSIPSDLIRKSRAQALKRLHPDSGGHGRMELVERAVTILTDSEKRAVESK